MVREVEATITAVTTVSGEYRYGWRQIFPAAVGGAATDATAGLIGSTTLNYAVERNNISVDVGARVTVREYGFVGNQMVWVVAFLADARGMNIRNRMCHGLMAEEDFNRWVSDRVLHTLLMLGTCRRKKPEEPLPQPERGVGTT